MLRASGPKRWRGSQSEKQACLLLWEASHCLGPPALSDGDASAQKPIQSVVRLIWLLLISKWSILGSKWSISGRFPERETCLFLGTVRGAFLQVSVPFSFQSYSFSFFHHVLGLTDLKSNETHRNAKEIFYAFHCAYSDGQILRTSFGKNLKTVTAGMF